jgi:hypothetical protein
MPAVSLWVGREREEVNYQIKLVVGEWCQVIESTAKEVNEQGKSCLGGAPGNQHEHMHLHMHMHLAEA